MNKVILWLAQRKKFLIAEVPVLVALAAALQDNGIDGTEWNILIGLQLAAFGVHAIKNAPKPPPEGGDEA